MTPEEIQEANKLIAEFMGKTIVLRNGEYAILNSDGRKCYLRVWATHSKDWNELMKVVEKIESMEHFEPGVMTFMPVHYQVTISEQSANVLLDGRVIGQCFAVGKTKIESVYQVCVKFIQWYQGNRK